MENQIDLLEYVTRFSESQHEAILKQVVVGTSLEKAFRMPGGMAIISSCVDRISTKIGELLVLTDKGFDQSKEKIKQTCLEIKITRQFMAEWAALIEAKKTHEENARKQMGG